MNEIKVSVKHNHYQYKKIEDKTRHTLRYLKINTFKTIYLTLIHIVKFRYG